MSEAAIDGLPISYVVGVGMVAIGCFVVARCVLRWPVFRRMALDKALALQDQSDRGSLDEKRDALPLQRDHMRL
jgi:hypothetical protein